MADGKPIAEVCPLHSGVDTELKALNRLVEMQAAALVRMEAKIDALSAKLDSAQESNDNKRFSSAQMVITSLVSIAVTLLTLTFTLYVKRGG